MSAKKQPLTAAEKMLASKRKLVARLKRDIDDINDDAQTAINKVKARIRIADTIIDALEKGTLKP